MTTKPSDHQTPEIVARLRLLKPHLFRCSRCPEGISELPSALCPPCRDLAKRNQKRKHHLRHKRTTFVHEACVYCGNNIPGEMTLDHAHPIALGGTSEPGNLVPCCKSCNGRKGNKPFWVFVAEAFAMQRNPYENRRKGGARLEALRQALGVSREEWNRPPWQRPRRPRLSLKESPS